MAAVASPAMSTPAGIVRVGFFTSWPTNDVISNPEKAKHIADHRLSVPRKSTSIGGTIDAGVNGVADP